MPDPAGWDQHIFGLLPALTVAQRDQLCPGSCTQNTTTEWEDCGWMRKLHRRGAGRAQDMETHSASSLKNTLSYLSSVMQMRQECSERLCLSGSWLVHKSPMGSSERSPVPWPHQISTQANQRLESVSSLHHSHFSHLTFCLWTLTFHLGKCRSMSRMIPLPDS